ncbi:MAG: hypothetical protein IH595_02355 [Bacteroidales bacterium]|nr:hypothetical protein [Bacteroidales bacterium]
MTLFFVCVMIKKPSISHAQTSKAPFFIGEAMPKQARSTFVGEALNKSLWLHFLLGKL